MKSLSRDIGKFQHKITLQYQSRTPDGAGGWSNSWVDDLTVWAKITPMTGKQALVADKIEGEQAFKFTIRHTDDFLYTLDNNYRIKRGSSFYNIHSVTVLEEENNFIDLVGWKI